MRFIFSCQLLSIVFFAASVSALHAQKIPTAPRNTIWVSSTASADVIANRESIAAFAEKAKRAGFDTDANQ